MIIEINRGQWERISCVVAKEDARISKVVHNRNQPRFAPDTLNFNLFDVNKELVDYFVNTHTRTPVRVYQDDLTFVFEGDIRTGSSYNIENRIGVLSITAEDICTRMDIPAPEDEWALRGADLQTIANLVSNFCGVPYDFPIQMSQQVVPYFVIDEANCLEELDKLFYYYGWVLCAKYDSGRAVVSAYDWWNRFLPSTFHEIDCNRLLIPVNINPREINYDVINVEWTIAGHFDRGHTGDSDGLLLYHLGTDAKVAISADAFYPERGDVEKVYQSYTPNSIRSRSDSKQSDYSQSDLLLRGGNPKDTQIIYAWGQYVKYIAQSVTVKIPGGDSRPEVIVSGSPDIPRPLVIDVELHFPLRSRVVFKNQTKTIADLIKELSDRYGGDSINVGIDFSKGWTMELRDFVILGNAIYSQGEGNASVGIFTEGQEQVIKSVVRSQTRAIIYLEEGSEIQNHYQGYRVISDNGTNAIVDSYNASTKSLVINDFTTVSQFDTVGTRINLISPTEGTREENLSTDYVYTQTDANNLAEGRKNEDTASRIYFEYDSTIEHPGIGEYVLLKHESNPLLNEKLGMVVGWDYSPDNENDRRVEIQVKQIKAFNPIATYPGKLIKYPPINQPPTSAGGWEIIRAITNNKNLLPGQYPNNNWGYRTPGTRGELEWRNYP